MVQTQSHLLAHDHGRLAAFKLIPALDS